MTQDGVHRRLSAILVADVVGYARLMEADEIGTLAMLNARRREIIEPAVSSHQGRIVKEMGDGFLIEFASVVEAVQCAIDVQSQMEARNTGIPDQQKMRLRIGINLGDVLVDHDDLFGDSVNIAARLQAMAGAGDVLLSGTVYEQLKGKIATGYEFLGDQRVKNIAESIPVYRLLKDEKSIGKTIGKARRKGQPVWRAAFLAALIVVAGLAAFALKPAIRDQTALTGLPLPEKPSIAVLPFANMSGDSEQGYFAAGVTDGLITDLSQVSGLFVISRNSSFAYKDRNLDIRQIAGALGVRYVLEGSIQRAGDQVRINVQLIDSDTGGHVWAERYDGSLSDVFLFQDKVTRSVTDALALRLTSAEQQALAEKQTEMPAAYDAFLRGWEHFRRSTPQDFDLAIPYFEQAIALDPGYGRAHAAMALVHCAKALTVWSRGNGALSANTGRVIEQHLQEAKKKPTSTSHQASGVLASGFGLYPEAINEFKEAIALDPSDSWSYAYMARALTFAGRPRQCNTSGPPCGWTRTTHRSSCRSWDLRSSGWSSTRRRRNPSNNRPGSIPMTRRRGCCLGQPMAISATAKKPPPQSRLSTRALSPEARRSRRHSPGEPGTMSTALNGTGFSRA